MTMPILDIQKRSRELGRIRIGQVVPTTRKDGSTGTRPEKLDRFRLTSNARHLLDKVAELYGGEVAEWQPQGGGAPAWEVITTSTRLPIMVPPQPVTQWYEYWTRAGCIHRCDGRTNVLTDELCDPEDDAHLEALRRPTTRLSVVLRDVEGIGVWRLETHGWNAAVELPDAAEFLARAGGYVEGWVSLEQRTSIGVNAKTGKPETRHFMVPIIEIDVTPAELMAGRGRVATPELEGPAKPREVPALEAPAQPAAAEQPPAERLPGLTDINAAATVDAVYGIYSYLDGKGALTPELKAACMARREQLNAAPAQAAPVPDADGVVDAEIVEPPTPAGPEPDPDVVWQQILAVVGQRGMNLEQLTDDFTKAMGMIPDEASGAELAAYLTLITTGEAGAA